MILAAGCYAQAAAFGQAADSFQVHWQVLLYVAPPQQVRFYKCALRTGAWLLLRVNHRMLKPAS